MASKYLIFGATYNGDGTTSSEAASNGAAGAWSQATILTGTAPTYGTLAAGDTVYIRSQTGNGANANISNTLSGSITLGAGSGVATAASPITWVLDNGTTWSGVNGTLTYQDGAATNYTVTLRDFNNFISRTRHSWIFKAVNTSSDESSLLILGSQTTDGLFQDANISSTAGRIVSIPFSKYHVAKNFKLAVSSRSFSGAISHGGQGTLVFENIDWNNTYDVASSGSKPLIYFGAASGLLKFVGGRCYGAGATSGVAMVVMPSMSYSCSILGVGFSFPVAMMSVPVVYEQATVQSVYLPISFVGADNGLGAVLCERWGQRDSRDDSNYPYLNATLPDSAATGWSWRLWPFVTSPGVPMHAVIANKVYTASAATATVNLEVLIADTITTCDKSNTWIDVTYIDDATGLPVSVSSRDLAGGSLAAGSSSWQPALTYAATTLVPFKLSVSTAGDIKQDTQIQVTLNSTVGITTLSTDFWFACPDVYLT